MTTPTTMTPRDWAAHAWRIQHRDRRGEFALTDWAESIAADGRPMHSARVDHPDAVLLLHSTAEGGTLVQGVHDAQQRPYLDVHTPGRIALLWLLNGEWIEYWAPEPTAVPEPVHIPPAAQAHRPSGRLPFTRRTKTPKGRSPMSQPIRMPKPTPEPLTPEQKARAIDALNSQTRTRRVSPAKTAPKPTTSAAREERAS